MYLSLMGPVLSLVYYRAGFIPRRLEKKFVYFPKQIRSKIINIFVFQ